MSRVVTLLQKDFRVVYRDGFIALFFFYPAVIALVARAFVPMVPIEHFDLYMGPLMLTLSAPMLGTVLGYSLIEEREQQTWLLMRVLPMPELSLFGYLAAVAGVLSIAMSIVAAVLYGLRVVHPLWFIVLLVASAPCTAMFMLLLGAVARNKVEGLALSKALGPLSFVPALVFLLPPAWQVLLYWNPFYWLSLGFLEAYAGGRVADLPLYWPDHSFALMAVVPFVLALLYSWPLARIYRRRAR